MVFCQKVPSCQNSIIATVKISKKKKKEKRRKPARIKKTRRETTKQQYFGNWNVDGWILTDFVYLRKYTLKPAMEKIEN